MRTATTWRLATLLLPFLLLLGAGPAHALVICAGPCPPAPEPPPGPGVIDLDPIFVPPDLGLLVIVLPSDEDFVFEWGGDVVVQVPTGGSVLQNLDLAAVDDIAIETGASVTLEVAGSLSLCAAVPSCVPDPEALPGSFSVGVRLPSTGQNVTVVSGGSISVLVPEPRVAGLALAGALGLLVAGRRRAG